MEFGKRSTFHTSNIRRAWTFLYTNLSAPPEGRFDNGNETIKRKAERQVFQARKRYKPRPAPLFSPFFSGKTEKNGPAEQCCLIAAQKPAAGGTPRFLRTRKLPLEAPRHSFFLFSLNRRKKPDSSAAASSSSTPETISGFWLQGSMNRSTAEPQQPLTVSFAP